MVSINLDSFLSGLENNLLFPSSTLVAIETYCGDFGSATCAFSSGHPTSRGDQGESSVRPVHRTEVIQPVDRFLVISGMNTVHIPKIQRAIASA